MIYETGKNHKIHNDKEFEKMLVYENGYRDGFEDGLEFAHTHETRARASEENKES